MIGTAPAVTVRELRKSYRDRAVLAGINFEIDSGEVFALLGPNGTGKTTTVEILEGYRDPTAGEVRVLGFDPWTHPIELRERTGVVLQECGFPNHLRVGELLDAWRGYYREPRPTAELLELVDLTAERSTLVRRLSGGQRRRLDLALALAGDPDVIFLDEPTIGFDPEARRRCWAAIENLSTLGKCIVLTTHYLDEAERLADRIAILADGRIRAIGTAVELAHLARAPTLIRLRLPASVPLDSELVLDGAWFCDNGTLTVRTQHPSAVLQELIHAFDELPELVVTPPNLEASYLTLVADTEPLPA